MSRWISARRFPRPLPRFFATLLIGALLAMVVVAPQLFGLQTTFLWAQIIAFRALLALGLGASAVVFSIVAFFRRRRLGIAAATAIVLAAASIANGGILIVRGSGGTGVDGDLTVLAWNTQGGAVPPRTVAELVIETGADIVSLPEMDDVAAREVARIVASEGRGMKAGTTFGETGDSWIPTSLLLDARLGDYVIDGAAGSTPGLPSAVWRSTDGRGPMIVAAHPMPPLPGGMDDWRDGLSWVAERCDSSDVIIAGDLNATIDHLGEGSPGASIIDGCQDAALAAGSGADGTWPSSMPPWLASPIDHVLVGPEWIVRDARVITSVDGAGSDHRPIVVELDR